jgi:DNA ligase 1
MDPLMRVCETFEQISKTSGRLEKERLLRSLRDNPETSQVAKELLNIALDWYRHFGVRFLPNTNEYIEMPCLEHIWSEYVSIIGKLEKGGSVDRQELANILAGYPLVIGKWLRACMLKDLQMGVNYLTVNKIWPNCIKTFSVMLANPGDINHISLPVVAEPKIDGVRCIAIKKGDTINFVGRSGNELYHLDHIGLEILQLDLPYDYILDGELFAGSFPETMQVVRRSVNSPKPELLERLRYNVFDLLYLYEWEKQICHATYDARQLRLKEFEDLTFSQRVESIYIQDKDYLKKTVSDHLSDGYEGSILKNPKGKYLFKRSSDWLKIKPIERDSFFVLSMYGGSGRFKGMLGGVTVRLKDGKTSNVGGGFTKEQRQLFWEHQELILGKRIEVEYKWFTEDGHLREPVFTRVLEDEDEG